MKVREAMTADVTLASPDQTLREAAQAMADGDIGALPVAQGDRLVGMVTDRDIAVRGVAQGCGPDTKVSEVMSHEVMYCFEDEDLDHVVGNMGDVQLRRLPVLNREKRLVGIVALGDIASFEVGRKVGKALASISTPGGEHSQSTAIQ